MSDFRVVCFSKATGINSLIVLGLNEQEAKRKAYRWINFHGFNWIVKYAENLTVKEPETANTEDKTNGK